MEPVHASVLPDVPGEKTKISTSIVDTASSTMQTFGPPKKIHQHLCVLCNRFLLACFYVGVRIS
ncbi:hypothetical protein Hanom_Chr13g01243601 [Helianthus anomalus]